MDNTNTGLLTMPDIRNIVIILFLILLIAYNFCLFQRRTIFGNFNESNDYELSRLDKIINKLIDASILITIYLLYSYNNKRQLNGYYYRNFSITEVIVYNSLILIMLLYWLVSTISIYRRGDTYSNAVTGRVEDIRLCIIMIVFQLIVAVVSIIESIYSMNI